MLDDITPVILTWNEEANIGRTLDALSWARRIIVVDSGSTDGTEAICTSHPEVVFIRRAFDSHAGQWNQAVSHERIETDWILALDADYLVTPECREELAGLRPGAEICGYRAGFRYCVNGEPLRGALYPPVTVLFRRGRARYYQDGHTQRIAVDGAVAELRCRLRHDDRKSLERWLQAQIRYLRLESRKIGETAFSRLGWADRLRKTCVLAPPAVFVYTLFARRTLLDGRRGLFYATQRLCAEVMLSLFLLGRLLPGSDDRVRADKG